MFFFFTNLSNSLLTLFNFVKDTDLVTTATPILPSLKKG